jgi:lysozyme
MRTSHKGVEFIKAFEKFSSAAYICPAGLRTIGYGHVLLHGESYQNISTMEAEEILKHDLKNAERAVYRNITAPLEDRQFDALVSFVFNLGSASLQRSSLRQKINYGSDDDEIHREFVRWVYCKGQKLLGLVRRREAEATMYLCA